MYQGALRINFNNVHSLFIQDHTSCESNFFCPNFGDLALQAEENGNFNNSHIETGRRFIRRNLKNGSYMKINMFPYLPVTNNPVSASMGNGNGRVYGWIFPCNNGRILYEISLDVLTSLKQLNLVDQLNGVSNNMPVNVRVINLIY